MSSPISLLSPLTTIKVSSTLDKSVAKHHLLDNNPETCWSSQQGIPQYIHITFTECVIPQRLSLTFQGGFVGIQCALQVLPCTIPATQSSEWHTYTHIYPEDVNRQQFFDLPITNESPVSAGIRAMKLLFEQSSDFFGRITVYDLKLEGFLVQS
ncbi:hypothetical protein AMATHDRAFT_2348 [Amanita thiersii Skay4041]|uniref:Uncharacterized protein n=1 Tax=Amanita thiersii Skay4041 TaxID=703135 RepID=A0A2A9NVP2_9AGAR|nr:hypothetical protein AMATHDRAFT_2348 [Amanita thiersii Skay4041]